MVYELFVSEFWAIITKAERDSFQATFHVLACNASSTPFASRLLGPWLFAAVAKRVALRARAKRKAQREQEKRLADMPRTDTIDEAAWQDLSSVLDEELGRLPDKYRAPLILSYLESKSRSRVAKELGWPEGTVARRLERGRELLRQHHWSNAASPCRPARSPRS